MGQSISSTSCQWPRPVEGERVLLALIDPTAKLKLSTSGNFSNLFLTQIWTRNWDTFDTQGRSRVLRNCTHSSDCRMSSRSARLLSPPHFRGASPLLVSASGSSFELITSPRCIFRSRFMFSFSSIMAATALIGTASL
jgi:hypothetical protein